MRCLLRHYTCTTNTRGERFFRRLRPAQTVFAERKILESFPAHRALARSLALPLRVVVCVTLVFLPPFPLLLLLLAVFSDEKKYFSV